MTDEVTPALSAEEWHQALQRLGDLGSRGDQFDRRGSDQWGTVIVPYSLRARHETAALCLLGQPFGFTQEDVSMLRGLAKLRRKEASRVSRDDIDEAMRPNRSMLVGYADALDALASRIAALLPPEVEK